MSVYPCKEAYARDWYGDGLSFPIPTFSIMAVVLSAYVLIRDRRSLKGLVAFAVAASLISGCWCYRNYTVFHKFVFVSTNGGSNLLIGNSWNASGTSDSSTMPAEDAAVGHSLFLDAAHTVPDEIAADRYYSQAAKQWIATHPHQALQLYIAKLIHYFGFEDHMATTDPGSYAGNSRITFILMAVSYGPLLAVLVCRLIFFRMIPLSFAECVIATLYLMNALLSAVFFTRIRFRLPMDWLLIAFVASSVCLVLGRLERPRALGQSTPVQ